MSDKPTGEWTVESNTGSNEMKCIMSGDQKVIGWTMRPYSESFQKIADAHNAALAAKREITFAAQQAALKEGIRSGELEQQLAAEREKHRKEMEAVTINTSDIETVQQLREQLAAATTGEQGISGLNVHQLREQLSDVNDMWDRASRQADTLAEYLVDAKAELSVAQEQFAAEREKSERLQRAWCYAEEKLTEIQQLREQQQALVDALNDVLAMDDGPRSSTFSDIFTNVRSALAKVKEGE